MADPVGILIGLGVGVPMLTLAVLLLATLRRDVQWLLEHWRDAASKAGLASIEVFPGAVTAYSGPLLVRFRELGDERGFGTELQIAGPGLAPGLTLEPEHSGQIGYQPHTRGAGEVEPVRPVIAASLALAERLVMPKDVAARLAFNLGHEPVAGIRRRILAILLRDFESHPATREALSAASRDEDPEIRLRAGIALEKEGRGREVLLALARGEKADDATGAHAVAALQRALDVESASELLGRALRGRLRRAQTAGACLKVLGRLGAEAVPRLASVLAVERDEFGEAAVRALGETGDASAEEPLLAALADDALAAAAAAALGHVGSRAAVAPLREAEERGGALRAAARQATAQIQSRLTGAEQGQLSLAGGEAGGWRSWATSAGASA
jgi:hypothetical protein